MNNNPAIRMSLRRDQRGSVIVTIAGVDRRSLRLAWWPIDGAILMTTKNQLQSAADAAALAGASGLKYSQERPRAAIRFAGFQLRGEGFPGAGCDQGRGHHLPRELRIR